MGKEEVKQDIQVGELVYIFEDPKTEKKFEGIAKVKRVIEYTKEYVTLLVNFDSESGLEPDVTRTIYFL